MMLPTRSCCQMVHLMPNCCGSIAQARHDHWEVLEIVAATLKLGVHPWPLKIGIRYRSLARLKCVVEDNLGSWELASMKLVSATDSSLWMTLDVSTEATCGCNSDFVCVSAAMEGSEDVSVAMDFWISSQQLSSSVQSEDVQRPMLSPKTSDAKPCTSRLISSS